MLVASPVLLSPPVLVPPVLDSPLVPPLDSALADPPLDSALEDSPLDSALEDPPLVGSEAPELDDPAGPPRESSPVVSAGVPPQPSSGAAARRMRLA